MKYRKLSSIYFEDKMKFEQLYERRFNSESSYRFDLKIGESIGFVFINPSILEKLDDIRKLDKALSEKVNKLPSIALMQYTRKCLVDEIKLTNDIEGVVSTRKEISEILNDITGKKQVKRLYGLVKKYELLLEEPIELSTCDNIKSIYDSLVLKAVIYENPSNIPDGEIFRKDKVYIKSPNGRTIHTGLYPEELIIDVMQAGLDILNNEQYNKLIRIAVFHYIFGYAHPYYDGNGRTSRFISSYLLSRELHPLISYRISHTIKENINMYYKSFKIANDSNNKGELTHFVDDFLVILRNSLIELCEIIDEKNQQLKYFENQIKFISGKDEKTLEILGVLLQNSLFGEFGIDIVSICGITHIGSSKVRNVIRKLNEENYLRVGKDGKKKIYDIELDKLKNLKC